MKKILMLEEKEIRIQNVYEVIEMLDIKVDLCIEDNLKRVIENIDEIYNYNIIILYPFMSGNDIGKKFLDYLVENQIFNITIILYGGFGFVKDKKRYKKNTDIIYPDIGLRNLKDFEYIPYVNRDSLKQLEELKSLLEAILSE